MFLKELSGSMNFVKHGFLNKERVFDKILLKQNFRQISYLIFNFFSGLISALHFYITSRIAIKKLFTSHSPLSVWENVLIKIITHEKKR